MANSSNKQKNYVKDAKAAHALLNNEKLKLDKKLIDDVSYYEKHVQELNNKTLEQEQLESAKRIQKFVHEQRIKDLEDEGKKLQASILKAYGGDGSKSVSQAVAERAAATALSGATQFLDKFESKLDGIVNRQTAMVAHLNGSGSSLTSTISNLSNTLGTTGLVRQEAVYNNLSKLISSGITYNVEQRAFLQTIADDIDAVFNATDGSLIRLINLQRQDLSANRLAIEYNLQEFLNQNYQNSTYIKESFQNVSAALLETQSLMSARGGMALESTVQTWLGSLGSSGMSSGTVNSLATAIGNLGSGNIDGLGSGISNLLLMGAARSGLDYGKLLTNGLSASDADKLMFGVSSYLAEMSNSSSNVVRSQLGKVFGVNVSDMVAAGKSNFNGGSVGYGIDNLLGSYGSIVPWAAKYGNFMDNMLFSMAMQYGNGSSGANAGYTAFKGSRLAASILSPFLSPITTELKIPFLGGVDINLGQLASALPILTLLPTIGSLFNSMGASGGDGALGLFNALGTSRAMSALKSAGVGFTSSSGLSTSSSIYANNGNLGDISSGGINSSLAQISNLTSNIEGANESFTATDIYNQLEEAQVRILPSTLGTITTGIASGNASRESVKDILSFTYEKTAHIDEILTEYHDMMRIFTDSLIPMLRPLETLGSLGGWADTISNF